MDPLRHFRSEIERGITRAWDSLTDGWRELLSRSGSALTHFTRSGWSKKEEECSRDFPRWSLLAAEVWETAGSVIVRLEVPGLDKKDLDVSIRANALRVRGNKHAGERHEATHYHLMERAFGRFERTILLPHSITAELADIAYQDGVLTVILPKTETVPPRHLPIP
jgi:HSP20 family protein